MGGQRDISRGRDDGRTSSPNPLFRSPRLDATPGNRRGLSGFFVYQVQKAIRLVLVGGPDHRTDAWFSRVIEVATGWLGQKRVLEDRVVGVLHVLMFWGFLMLSSDMLDLATANWFSGSLLPSALVGPWNGMVELGYASALVGVWPPSPEGFSSLPRS